MEGLENMRDLMIRLGDSLKAIEAKVANPMPVTDISNTEVMSKMADEIRKTHFRKKDPTAQIVGSAMGVIALIASMTAIIQPMNRSIADLRKEIVAVEERVERRLNLKNQRLLRLEEGDKEDKRINAMVEILFKERGKP